MRITLVLNLSSDFASMFIDDMHKNVCKFLPVIVVILLTRVVVPWLIVVAAAVVAFVIVAVVVAVAVAVAVVSVHDGDAAAAFVDAAVGTVTQFRTFLSAHSCSL